MRRLALPIALAALAIGALPALADGGLPELASLPVGPFLATVHGDSPTLVTGPNTLTVEVPMLLPEGHAVSLSLDGPRGEHLLVPLRPVQVVDSPADEHAGHGDAHAAAADPTAGHAHEPPAPASATHAYMPGMSHDMPGMVHEPAPTAPSPATAHHAQAESTSEPSYLARGVVSVPEPGVWKARLVVSQVGGERFLAEAPLLAQDDGPSPMYLAGTGSLMAGFLIFGAIQRRRQRLAAVAPNELR